MARNGREAAVGTSAEVSGALLIVCRPKVCGTRKVASMKIGVAARRFGETVRRFREDEGISQEELADRCGLHRTYIGSVERGERNVSLGNIVRLAQALKKAPAALLDGLG